MLSSKRTATSRRGRTTGPLATCLVAGALAAGCTTGGWSGARHDDVLLGGVVVEAHNFEDALEEEACVTGLRGNLQVRVSRVEGSTNLVQPGERLSVAVDRGVEVCVPPSRWQAADGARLLTLVGADVDVGPGPLVPGGALSPDWIVVR